MTNAVQTKAVTIADSINGMESEFARALPAHIPSDRFTRIAVSAVNSNPDLLSPEIDRRSLYAAVMKAAADGLVIDGRESALVTFKGKNGVTAQYMPMVAGILKKMRNSGEISNISTGVVYRNEYDQGRFKYVKGDTESLTHDPILFEDKGALIGVYAVVTLKDGAKVREFMDVKQIAKVKAVSRSGGSEHSPWNKWYEEMATKSVLRKVSKLCPMSNDLDAVFKNDEDNVDIDSPPELVVVTENEPAEKPKRARKTAAEIVKEAEPETIREAEYAEIPEHTQEQELPI